MADVWQGPGTTGIGAARTGSGINASQRVSLIEKVIHRQYLNGSAPLLAMMQGSQKETVDKTDFKWFTKLVQAVSEHLTRNGTTQGYGTYVDANAATLYTSGAAANRVLYVRVLDTAGDLSTMDQFRQQQEVLLRREGNISMDCVGMIDSVNRSGCIIGVRLSQADPNTTGSTNWDVIRVIGNISPENGVAPESISLKPSLHENYIQTFWDPVRLSSEAMVEPLETGSRYLETKKDALDMHTMAIEQAMIYGKGFERISAINNQPERAMTGLIPFIKANAPANVGDYRADTDYSGFTWLEGGWEWIEKWLSVVFKYGSAERLGFCGTGTITALKWLADKSGQINLEPGSKTSFGLVVTKWVTDFGVVGLKTHPLFSHDLTDAYSAVIFDPKNVRYVRFKGLDTKYLPDPNKGKGGDNVVDGVVEGWRTKCSMKIYLPNEAIYINGFGKKNTLAKSATHVNA